MRVLVLGGDGYLGWPAALRFAARGHEAAIVDNQLRRRYDLELGTSSLAPIASLPDRVSCWRELTGNQIDTFIGDLTDPDFVTATLADFAPDTVIHLGEQRSAPYSMLDRAHAVHTQTNNVIGTLNLVWAIVEIDPSIHLIKLGTMGAYGTGGQTRASLNILDTMSCLELAAEHPSSPGEFRVFNQFTESLSVLDLAQRVSRRSGADIDHLLNPRVELDQHHYRAANTGLLDLGLEPHLLTDAVIDDLLSTAAEYRQLIDTEVIWPATSWRPERSAQLRVPCAADRR